MWSMPDGEVVYLLYKRPSIQEHTHQFDPKFDIEPSKTHHHDIE